MEICSLYQFLFSKSIQFDVSLGFNKLSVLDGCIFVFPPIISASVSFFWMSLGIRIRVRSKLLCSPIITLWWIFYRKLPFLMNYKANFSSYFPLNWPCRDISISKWSRHRTRIPITFQLRWRNAHRWNVCQCCVKRSHSHVAIGMVMSINHIIMKIIFNWLD